jgi:hypothetical protein
MTDSRREMVTESWPAPKDPALQIQIGVMAVQPDGDKRAVSIT